MKHKLLWVLPVVVLVLLIASCDSNKVFDEYQTIPDASWNADSLLHFSFMVGRKTDNHNIYFNIRNDRKYEFSNLWLFVTIHAPGGTSVTDTTQVILAEPSGKWLGKGFTGVYDNRFVYRRNVYFPESGRYNVAIRHGMRPKELKGIRDLGIRIEKVH